MEDDPSGISLAAVEAAANAAGLPIDKILEGRRKDQMTGDKGKEFDPEEFMQNLNEHQRAEIELFYTRELVKAGYERVALNQEEQRVIAYWRSLSDDQRQTMARVLNIG